METADQYWAVCGRLARETARLPNSEAFRIIQRGVITFRRTSPEHRATARSNKVMQRDVWTIRLEYRHALDA